jgi:galactitol-specific phosphotransferase system IIB component
MDTSNNIINLNDINQTNNINYKKTDYFCSFVTDIHPYCIENKKILVVCDIDKTILREYKGEGGELVFKEVEKYQYKMKLEQNSVELINNLTKCADVICLTARHFEYYMDLQQYGFNLCNTYNKIDLTTAQQQQMNDNGYIYSGNVIYASGKEKTTALLMFYDFSETKYDKVFFIDDMQENCEQINKVLTDHNIDITTYQIQPSFKELDNIQIEKNNSIEEIISKQHPYFYTKCETLVDQPITNDLIVADIIF